MTNAARSCRNERRAISFRVFFRLTAYDGDPKGRHRRHPDGSARPALAAAGDAPNAGDPPWPGERRGRGERIRGAVRARRSWRRRPPGTSPGLEIAGFANGAADG